MFGILNINGIALDKQKLEEYIEKFASDNSVTKNSDIQTYPINDMLKNFEFITRVYNLLNEHVKLKINIHPAGEWLLDNYYIIEENVKSVQKELSLNKYKNLMKNPIVLDGRNCYNLNEVAKLDIKYYSIGR